MKHSILFILIGATGCGAHASAQRLAQENLAQVVEYRESLEAMSTTIINHYAKTRAALDEELRAKQKNINDADIDAAASLLADETVKSGFSESAYERYLAEIVKTRLEAHDEIDDKVAQLEAATVASTDEIAAKLEQLQAIEVKLGQLQRPRHTSQLLDDLRPIISAANTATNTAIDTATSKALSKPSDGG